MQEPFYPIIYIRGYAGSQNEVEDTVADPYMGFNLGSSKRRQLHTGDIEQVIFESPLIRLMKDYNYKDVYKNGNVMPSKDDEVSDKTIWIFRYYDEASEEIGSGKRSEMEKYGEKLYEYLNTVRDVICKGNVEKINSFKVHLVAHSMGGLVARTYLQNTSYDLDKFPNAVTVDKVFTYGTPHGGIDFKYIGNMPSFMRFNNQENFNTERMREYLKLQKDEKDVKSLDGKFPPEKFFSFMGSGYKDYAVAYGISSALVGPMSDGLVRLKNAYVKGSSRAVTNRAHSGHYGIVNSESGYQNLVRFLFGDYKVTGELIVSSIELPPKVEKKKNNGSKIRASYHIDVVTGTTTLQTNLHRRVKEESSALFKKYDELLNKPIKLFSMFLSKKYRAQNRKNIFYSLDLKIYVPEYEIDNKYWFDDHIEGELIFSKLLTVELSASNLNSIKYTWTDEGTKTCKSSVQDDEVMSFDIPIKKRTKPNLEATLRLNISNWNVS